MRISGRHALIAAALASTIFHGAATQAATDAKALHARILPLDAHLDIDPDFDSPASPANVDGKTQFDLPKARAGGVKAVTLAVFAGQEEETPATLAAARAIAETKHRIISGLSAHYPGQVEQAFTPADVRRITASGKLAVIESIVNGGAFVDNLDDLDHWAAQGVRLFGFVHAGHNRLADSSRPSKARGEGLSRNGGLSPLGKQAVERLNALGVLIDVSQLSDPAFADVLRLTKAPVIASHSDIRTLVGATRNLTDAQLDAIKANGGVVGINAFSTYLRPADPAFTQQVDALKAEFGLTAEGSPSLSAERQKDYDQRFHALAIAQPKATVADLVNAVNYAVKRIGIDHVGLSSDFNHGGGVTGWNSEAEAANVTAELVRRGYSDADIAKLWSGNVLRIWGEAQARATRRKS